MSHADLSQEEVYVELLDARGQAIAVARVSKVAHVWGVENLPFTAEILEILPLPRKDWQLPSFITVDSTDVAVGGFLSWQSLYSRPLDGEHRASKRARQVWLHIHYEAVYSTSFGLCFLTATP